MGFFSKLAKKLVNKTDDEAVNVIKREAPLPPPRRVVDAAPIVPPPSGIGPPARIPVTMAEEPPPPVPPYMVEMEEAFRNLPTPDYSQATVDPTGKITGLRFPTRAPAVPAPTRSTVAVTDPASLPVPDAQGPAIQPPPRVLMGESYEGLTPTQRAAARLRTLQAAGTQSKVKDIGGAYEMQPPQKMGRFEAMGRGFLQRMAHGAPYGIGGMLGAGLVGVGEGIASPGRVQSTQRQMEIGQAQGELARAGELEQQGLQNEARRLQNLQLATNIGGAEDERDREMAQAQRVEYYQGLNNIGELQKQQSLLDPKSAQYTAAQRAIEQEAARLSKRTGREVTVIPGNPKLNQLPRLQVDGQIVQQDYDGKWKAVYGAPKSESTDEDADLKATYDWQVKNTQNEAKRASALQAAKSFEETALDHQRKVAEAAGKVSTLDSQMAAMSPRDPALGPLKRQRADAAQLQESEQRKMDEAYKRAREKQAEAAEHPTLPPPPRRSKRATATSGQSLSKSAWMASPLRKPGETWEAAAAEAARRQIPVVP